LKIGFDGDRVVGSLCDEHGSIRTFSGWLDLLVVLEALRPQGVGGAPTWPAPGSQGLGTAASSS